MFRNVSEAYFLQRTTRVWERRLTILFRLCNDPGNVFGLHRPVTSALHRARKERKPMRRSSRLKASLATAVAVGCVIPAVLLIGAAPAAVTASSTSTAHKCLVMTGSGDPAFTKNFNPYTATGLPSGTFVQGAFYEPLVITPLGGLPSVPWLARSWKWTNGNKTLTLNLARGVKWSDGKPLNSADVVYSFTAGRQDKIMDRVGLTGADNNIASVKAKGLYQAVIRLRTPDSQFISSTLNRQFVVPKHVWSKVRNVATYTNSKPVG